MRRPLLAAGLLVALVALPGAEAPARAQEGSEDADAAASRPEVAESADAGRIRAICLSSSSPEEKVRLLVALGPEALKALVIEAPLAPLAREWVPRVFELATDEQLGAICEAWRADADEALERSLAFATEAPPRDPLVQALVRAAADPSRGSARSRDALARGILARGPGIVDRHLFGAGAVTGTARIFLASALGASGRADATSSLSLLLGEDETVASAAAGGLGRCPDPTGEGVAALIDALRLPSPLVRRSAAFALGRLRASEALDALATLLEQPAAGAARRLAGEPEGGAPEAEGPAEGRGAWAPGAAGADEPAGPAGPAGASQQPPPPPPLEGADAVVTDRSEAHAALREITNRRDVPPDAAAWRAVIEEARRTADLELPVLLAEASSGDPVSAPSAARRLAAHPVRRDRIRPTLLRLLESRLPEERVVAASTLGALRDAAATEPLIRALGDPDAEVWAAAHLALKEALRLDLPAKPEPWRRRWLMSPVAAAPAAPARLRPARTLPDDEDE